MTETHHDTQQTPRWQHAAAMITIVLLLVLIGISWGESLTPPTPAADTGADTAEAANRPITKMTTRQSLILGIIEGATEFIPVSSTGHLLVAQRIMGIGSESERAKDAADAYAIVIQLGAILAVLGLYYQRAKQVGRGLMGHDTVGRTLGQNLIIAFIPAAVIGLLFNDMIKDYLFGDWSIVAAWFVGGLLILGVAYHRKAKGAKPDFGLTVEQITWRIALFIGFSQCIAMWPGVSRSLITIVAGAIMGLSLKAAVEFSFLLGVITLGAATFYDGWKHGALLLEVYSPFTLIVGLVAAFLSGLLAVQWMLAYLNRHGIAIFGYYRIIIAILVAVLLMYELI